MGVDLYIVPASHNCRSVLMALKAAECEGVTLKEVNMQNGEHMTPEYLKMNPHHTVPTLDDNGFYLYESRPIICYLVDKYGKKDSVFPKDHKKRATINKWLYYDLGSISNKISEYIGPRLFQGKPFDPEVGKKLIEALKVVDKQLATCKFVAGDELSIADLTIASNVSMLELDPDLDRSELTNLQSWYLRMKELPYWEECNKGLNAFKEMVKGK